MKPTLALLVLLLVSRAAGAQSPDPAQEYRANQQRINDLIRQNFQLLNADLAVIKADLDSGRHTSESTLRRADQMLRTIKELQQQHTELSYKLAAAEARIGVLEKQTTQLEYRVGQLERENRELRDNSRRGAQTLGGYSNPLYYSSRAGTPISSYSPVFGSASSSLYRARP